jgi:hypothetical protein
VAYFWYLIASANGDKKGRRFRKRLEKELNVQQRNKIQTLATKWFEEHR